jgi:RNA polymerase sigma-70 factor (ECF subfamily)
MTEKNRRELSGGSPEETYRELIKNYGGYVQAIVMNRLNRVGSREDIEDCISSVFVDLYAALEDFSEDKGSIKALIARIADRRAVDAFRRLSYRSNNTSGADEELLNVPAEDDTEAEIERKMMKKRLWEAVKSLGSPDSDIIVYQYYYNMKLRDIAEKLGMSADAVRKRSQRAREKLSEILKG